MSERKRKPANEYDRGYAFGYNAAKDGATKYGRSRVRLALRDLKAARSKDDFDRGYNKGFSDFLGL